MDESNLTLNCDYDIIIKNFAALVLYIRYLILLNHSNLFYRFVSSNIQIQIEESITMVKTVDTKLI